MKLLIIILLMFAVSYLISFEMGWHSCNGWMDAYANRTDIPIKWQMKCA